MIASSSWTGWLVEITQSTSRQLLAQVLGPGLPLLFAIYEAVWPLRCHLGALPQSDSLLQGFCVDPGPWTEVSERPGAFCIWVEGEFQGQMVRPGAQEGSAGHRDMGVAHLSPVWRREIPLNQSLVTQGSGLCSCLYTGHSSLSLAFSALHHHLHINPLFLPRSFLHFLPSKPQVEVPSCLCPCCFSYCDAAPLTHNYLSRVTCRISFPVGLFLSKSSFSHLL